MFLILAELPWPFNHGDGPFLIGFVLSCVMISIFFMNLENIFRMLKNRAKRCRFCREVYKNDGNGRCNKCYMPIQ